jgi:hypothetical protein
MGTLKTFRAICWLTFFLPAVLWCQAQGCSPAKKTGPERSDPHANRLGGAKYRLVRAIDDPGTQKHWLLIEDLSRPGTPALLIRTTQDGAGAQCGVETTETQSPIPSLSVPVIHAGESVLLLEHTPISDATFEATALQAAALGESLNVRTRLGGRTLKATATAIGRAAVFVTATRSVQ